VPAVGVEVPTIEVPLNERSDALESEEEFVPPCAMERVPEKSVSVTDAQVATPAPLSERTNWLVQEVPVNDCTPPVPFPTRSVEESVEEPVPPTFTARVEDEVRPVPLAFETTTLFPEKEVVPVPPMETASVEEETRRVPSKYTG